MSRRRRRPRGLREAIRRLEEVQGLPAGELAALLTSQSEAERRATVERSLAVTRDLVRRVESAGTPEPEQADRLQAILDALADLFELVIAAPPPAPAGPRPGSFAPEAITILSDPHTQAGIRGMWAPQEWEYPAGGAPFYRDKNGVMVYAKDAGELILGLDDAKANTLLICLGKWFAETNGNLAWPEAVRVYVEDILAFRGVTKHHKGGYRLEQKEATKADVLFLDRLWVRSHQTVWETARSGKRKRVAVDVDDHLAVVSLESTVDLWGQRTPYAFRFRPGPWAQHYLGGAQHWTTPVLQRIMRYHPERDRIKMRLGIYLTFQWRIRAGKPSWDQAWKLRTLLEGAKLELPDRHPERFFPRVLTALNELVADGVLAACEALDFPSWTPPADAPPKVWVPQLLDGRWRLAPAQAVRDRLPAPEAAPS